MAKAYAFPAARDVGMGGVLPNGIALLEHARHVAPNDASADSGGLRPTGGQPVRIEAGDTVFFPPKTTGVWHIEEAMRKVYVVLAQ